MSPIPQPEIELQHLSEIADAQLGVAEELGWAVSIFAALAAQLKWESWFVTLPVAIGVYVIAIYRYRRRAAIAEDNFYRVAGLGKYSGSHRNSDA